MHIRLDKSGPVPIRDQIKQQIVGLIRSGRLRPGDQLPTIRALSIVLAVNFNTVAHAYRELDAAGVIVTRRGEGTFVAPPAGEADHGALRHEHLRALAQALFDQAEHLGYTRQEVEQAVRDYVNSPHGKDRGEEK